jgi:ABC-type dipeptide/oligopeptide/nickel transport system permease subunit
MKILVGILLLFVAAVISLQGHLETALLGTLLFGAIVGVGATLIGGLGGMSLALLTESKFLLSLLQKASQLPALLLVVVALMSIPAFTTPLLMATLIIVLAVPTSAQFAKQTLDWLQAPCVLVSRQNGFSLVNLARQVILPLLSKSLFRSCILLGAWSIAVESSLAILGLGGQDAGTLAAILGIPLAPLAMARLCSLLAMILLACYLLIPRQERNP